MWPNEFWFGTSSMNRSRQYVSSCRISSRRHRRGIPPDYFVIPICERVLGVELKLIDLQLRQLVDEPKQRRHRRNLVAGDVEHHTADRKVGRVFDQDVRQLFRQLPANLLKRLAHVEKPGRIGAREGDCAFIDFKTVRLRSTDRRIDRFPNGRVCGDCGTVAKDNRSRLWDQHQFHACPLEPTYNAARSALPA